MEALTMAIGRMTNAAARAVTISQTAINAKICFVHCENEALGKHFRQADNAGVGDVHDAVIFFQQLLDAGVLFP